MEKEYLAGRVKILVGDITLQDVDAIINAANKTLLGGGGVDGAIHARGGKTILEECKKIRQNEFPQGLPTGHAVSTTGGNLKARFVIHTVGPVYGMNTGKDAELLAACYRNSLALAAQKSLAKIAFPSISTGAFQYPRHEAAAVSSQTIKEFLEENAMPHEVRLVFFQPADAEMFFRHQQFDA